MPTIEFTHGTWNNSTTPVEPTQNLRTPKLTVTLYGTSPLTLPTSSCNSRTSTGYTMEIDATHTAPVPRRPPLTPDERDHHHCEGLCLYCGQDSHFAANCPNTPRHAKAYVVYPAPSSPGKSLAGCLDIPGHPVTTGPSCIFKMDYPLLVYFHYFISSLLTLLSIQNHLII